MPTKPLLTAIIPTTAPRQPFLMQSLGCLQKQTLLDGDLLEAVFVTDDVESVERTLKELSLPIATTILEAEGPLGLKRNLACDHARGDWILFWDDDDWQRSDRVQRSVEACRSVDDAVGVIGSQTMLIHELGLRSRQRTFTYRYLGPQDATYPSVYFVGGLLGFRRDVWSRFPFADEDSRGEETWWQLRLWEAGIQGFEFNLDPAMYVAMIHGGNTANTQAPSGDPTWVAYPGSLYDDVMGSDLLLFREACFKAHSKA